MTFLGQSFSYFMFYISSCFGTSPEMHEVHARVDIFYTDFVMKDIMNHALSHLCWKTGMRIRIQGTPCIPNTKINETNDHILYDWL